MIQLLQRSEEVKIKEILSSLAKGYGLLDKGKESYQKEKSLYIKSHLKAYIIKRRKLRSLKNEAFL